MMRVSADVPVPPEGLADELELLRSRPQPVGVAALRAHLHDKLHWYLSALLFGAFLTAWQLIAAYGLIHEIILPAPLVVAKVFPEVVGHPLFVQHLAATLLAIFGGFLIGGSIGFGLGALFALSERWRKTLYPYVLGFQATPRVILAPLMIAWFGFGPASKIAQATIGCFFPIFLNTLIGLSLVDDNAFKLMRSLRANRWQMFRLLRFPYALPTIFAGVKVSLTFATIGVIVAEFIATEYGLGYELTRYHVEIAIPHMYAVIIIVGLVGLALFLAIEWIDKRVVFWRQEDVERSKLH
jgi:NitT/TauT family transport system permease protein